MAISLVTQYDLELYLRIEAALGKKLQEYPTEKAEVMAFQHRVEEAQRHARVEMKAIMDRTERHGKTGRKGRGGKASKDGMDAEEG